MLQSRDLRQTRESFLTDVVAVKLAVYRRKHNAGNQRTSIDADFLLLRELREYLERFEYARMSSALSS